MLAYHHPGSATDDRLAELEHERRELAVELDRVRAQVAEQRRQLRLVLDREEQSRRSIALELHDEAAQSLAGVLLGLDGLGPPEGVQADTVQLLALREEIRTTLVDLRRLATSLRPAVLDQLGLAPALERLAASANEGGNGSVKIVGGDRGDRLPSEVETLVYRIVEEALDLLAPPLQVQLDNEAGRGIRVVLTGWPRLGDRDPARFAAIRARLELAGGHLDVDTDADVVTVCASVPLRDD